MIKEGKVINKGSRIKSNPSILLPISARILDKKSEAFRMQISKVGEEPELEHPEGTSLVNIKWSFTKLGTSFVYMA